MDRNSLTLLAVLALSVSNLFVGITTQNKLLILASAGISASLALVYIARDLIAARQMPDEAAVKPDPRPSGALTRTRFPLWVFVVILFIILPALMWFMQYLAP